MRGFDSTLSGLGCLEKQTQGRRWRANPGLSYGNPVGVGCAESEGVAAPVRAWPASRKDHSLTAAATVAMKLREGRRSQMEFGNEDEEVPLGTSEGSPALQCRVGDDEAVRPVGTLEVWLDECVQASLRDAALFLDFFPALKCRATFNRSSGTRDAGRVRGRAHRRVNSVGERAEAMELRGQVRYQTPAEGGKFGNEGKSPFFAELSVAPAGARRISTPDRWLTPPANIFWSLRNLRGVVGMGERADAMELPRQVRSQIEFGNEGTQRSRYA